MALLDCRVKFPAPSLMSRVYNIETMLRRLRSFCNITAVSVENVRFDMQKMENPEVSGIEYQQGELHGYEVFSSEHEYT